MRLIRRFPRPANVSLLRQFRQYQVNKTFSGRLHPALIDGSIESNLVDGRPNILWHGRSYAASASASSVAMKARKPQSRVSKNERKSMVENYVKKFRETNAGKFPTASDAMKYVGGSYYVIRQILQELEFNSKQSSMDIKETSVKKSAKKKDDISPNIGDISQTGELGEVVRPILKEDIRNSTSKIFESKQGQQSSVSVEVSISDVAELLSAVASMIVQADKSKDVGTQSHHLIGKPESSQHPDPENSIKQEKLEDTLKFDGLEPKMAPQESTEISRREMKKMPVGDEQPRRKSSVWSNLKSFADELLSIWKRS